MDPSGGRQHESVPWDPPLLRVDGARDRPVLLDSAWGADPLDAAPVASPERSDAAGDQQPEALFLDAAATDPERARQIVTAGLVSCGLGLYVAALRLDPPRPEIAGLVRELVLTWLEGARLTERADEVALRARLARDVLDLRDTGQLTRSAAGALLDLPRDHPLRDDAAARRGLLRHLRALRGRSDPALEILAMERLVLDRVVGHRTAQRYLRRAFELSETSGDPELLTRVLTVATGYLLGRAQDDGLPPRARQIAAARAVGLAERLVALGPGRDGDDLRILASAYQEAGRFDEAAELFQEGLADGVATSEEVVWRTSIHVGLMLADSGDHDAAAGRLGSALPEAERAYLAAAGGTEAVEVGSVYTDAAATLALCHAAAGRPETAFSTLEHSKDLRGRHRAALRSRPQGQRFRELDRTLYAWQRGATVRFTTDRPVDVTAAPDAVGISSGIAGRLPADDRINELRRALVEALPSTRPAPPSVGDWAGRLAPDEAVLSIGTGTLGTWWAAITRQSASDGRVAAQELCPDWPDERWSAALSEPEEQSWLFALLTRRVVDLGPALDRLLVTVDEFLAPVAARLRELGVRRVRVSPHRRLRLVPFWATQAFADLTVVVLAAAVPGPPPPGGPIQVAAVVADPTGDLWTPAVEPEIVAAELAGVETQRFVRSDAVKSAVVAAAARSDLVHFAGHGRSDPVDPERSALWLHSGPAARALRDGQDPIAVMAAAVQGGWRSSRPGQREVIVAGSGLLAEDDIGDGVVERRLEHPLGTTIWIRGHHSAELWTADDITVGAEFPRCRLAVLTACEAAGAAWSDLEDVTGLPGALSAAGVQTVVASLWPVVDDVAAVFTALFYRLLGGALDRARIDVAELVDQTADELRGLSAGAAVRILEAMIDTTGDRYARSRLRGARYRRSTGPERPFDRPLHWAAFGVFGAGLIETGS
jgi:tetratricopeptide (TPR) repeat protein